MDIEEIKFMSVLPNKKYFTIVENEGGVTLVVPGSIVYAVGFDGTVHIGYFEITDNLEDVKVAFCKEPLRDKVYWGSFMTILNEELKYNEPYEAFMNIIYKLESIKPEISLDIRSMLETAKAGRKEVAESLIELIKETHKG